MDFINPDPVVCTCGYSVAKARHSDDCPMGQFWRWVEFQTARRCAEIAAEYGLGQWAARAIRKRFAIPEDR